MQAIRFGIDLAKSVFQVHGVDAAGKVVVAKALRRDQLLKLFAKTPRALIGMEACGSAHHWARELEALGHEVKLIPACYVKAYVKRNKNDARDAEAICEAVSRPTMRFVRVKSIEQQCARAIQRARELLTRQRTQLGNAIRGHLYEMGITAGEGAAGLLSLIERVEAADAAIPASLRSSLAGLARQWRAAGEEAEGLKEEIYAQVKTDAVAGRLLAIPGVGPISAHAVIAAIGDGSQFASGRDFAAWLGLTRKNYDTGGKHRNTGHISKAGDRALRSLLVLGASAWLRHVRVKPEKGSAWIRGVLGRRPVKVAVVAQAAKTARIIWAMLRSNKPYQAPAAA